MKTQIILTLFLLTLADSSRAQNLIDLNYGVGAGSFELGDFNTNDLDLRAGIMLVAPTMTNIVGWTVEGPEGVHWIDQTETVGTDGSKILDLQGETGALSAIWTTFPTIPGDSYLLKFDAYAGFWITNRATVTCGSLMDQEFSGTVQREGGRNPPFTNYTFSFTALSTSTTLRFQVTASDGYGPVIDDVSVEPLATRLSIRVSEVELCWYGRTNKSYQLQCRSNFPAASWTDVGVPVSGANSTNCTYEKIAAGQPRKFYRLVVTP